MEFVLTVLAATASVEGKMSKSLKKKKLMKKVASKEVTEQMAVADAKIGNIIKVYKAHILIFEDTFFNLITDSFQFCTVFLLS